VNTATHVPLLLHVTLPLSLLLAVYSSSPTTNVISSIGLTVAAVVAPEKFSNIPVIEKVHFSIPSATSISQSNTSISSLD
jgi:hypothetical protein